MANLTKWHIYGFVPPMGNTKVSHCATQWNILAFHLWLQHQVLVLNEFHTQVLKYFFQPLTSWRLSEAVSVSMVWMLSNYYSCSGSGQHFWTLLVKVVCEHPPKGIVEFQITFWKKNPTENQRSNPTALLPSVELK